jgi:hypothetical protein
MNDSSSKREVRVDDEHKETRNGASAAKAQAPRALIVGERTEVHREFTATWLLWMAKELREGRPIGADAIKLASLGGPARLEAMIVALEIGAEAAPKRPRQATRR